MKELASVVEHAPEHDPCRGRDRLVNGFIEQIAYFQSSSSEGNTITRARCLLRRVLRSLQRRHDIARRLFVALAAFITIGSLLRSLLPSELD